MTKWQQGEVNVINVRVKRKVHCLQFPRGGDMPYCTGPRRKAPWSVRSRSEGKARVISLSWREIVGWGRPPLSRISTTGQNNDVGDYYNLLHTKAGVINSLLKSMRIISNCSLPAPKLHHVSHTLQLLRRKKGNREPGREKVTEPS